MTKEMLHQLVEETCLRMFGCELREATEKQAYRALCVTVRMMLEDIFFHKESAEILSFSVSVLNHNS